MAIVIYTLDGTGTEIPPINIAQNTSLIIIQGNAIATGNYAISHVGSPNLSTEVNISYRGNLDITTNSTTFSILGQSFNQNDLSRELEITARWTGAAWKVITKKDFKEAGIIEAYHLSNNCVTTAAILDGSITEPKLATGAVSTVKIQDDAVTAAKINADVAGNGISQGISGALDVNVDNSTLEISAAADTVQVKDLGIITSKINDLAVTSAKLADSSVTTAKILNDNVTTAKIADDNVTNAKLASDSVTTVKILDGAVTNSKLATMSNSSIKIGNATGVPTDLVLGNNEIPIGNGSTVTKFSRNNIKSGIPYVVSMEVSLEEDEQIENVFYVPATSLLTHIDYQVTKSLSGTDDANFQVRYDGISIPIGTTTILQSTSAGTESTLFAFGSPTTIVQRVQINATKFTTGGRVRLFLFFTYL